MSKTKKTSSTSSEAAPAPKSKSKLPAGKGAALKSNTRIISVYSVPKTFKTTAVSTLPLGRTKWLVSDPNCIPTLQSLGRLPHPDDIYSFPNLVALKEWLEGALKLAKEEGPEALGIDFLVLDSSTQFSDDYQREWAAETGQKFLGDNKSDNGWQGFNAMFGAVLDLLAALKEFVSVIIISHAKPKLDLKKGEYSGFSLSPAMAEKLGRLSNWVLFKTAEEIIDEDEKKRIMTEKADSPWYIIIRDPDAPDDVDRTKVLLTVFHTRTVSGWFASVEKGPLAPEEPGTDIMLLLEKAGLT